MRIQTKLFLLLLAIAIVPLVTLSWRSEQATENLGEAVVEHGRRAVVDEIENQLAQAVSFSSSLLTAQQRQVEFALRFQAVNASRLLTMPEPEPASGPIYMNTDFDNPRLWPPDTELTLERAIASPEGALQAMPVSRNHPAFLLAPGVQREDVEDSIHRLVPMVDVFRTVSTTNPGLFYWQYVSLENGVHSVYPGHGGYPATYDARMRVWYGAAVQTRDLSWTPPFMDATTRRLLLTASMPIIADDGSLLGATGIDVDILRVLGGVHSRTRIGAEAESYIVAVEDDAGQPYLPGTSDGEPVLRVFASSLYRDTGVAWDAVPETPVLRSGTPQGMANLAEDLAAGGGGSRRMPHNGRESLWVYGSLEQVNSALLYIVPVDSIESIANQAQFAVSQAVFDQIRLAGIASVTLIVVVAVIAMLAARSVTGPLRALAATATGLAGGNLEARARVKSSDEVGQLARAFNAMIPQLRSHISTKESLALACEVQQKLLPKSPPQIPNIEIAGRCAYSEDVGGDYYDFIQFPMTSGGQRVGIVVGDVVGHGVVAALTMTAVRALLRSHASDGSDLSAVMNAVNRHVAADASGGRFITLVYLVIDSNPRRIRWISAGHGPTLLYDVKNDTFDELPIEDIPLGIRPNWAFRECGREGWPEPAVLVMGTDGIWETRDASGATFGKPRLMQLIRAYAHLSAEDICDKVVEQLRAFAGDEPQRDDITLVVVKFAPSERAS